MKTVIACFALPAVLLCSTILAEEPAAPKPDEAKPKTDSPLKTQKEKLGYALGLYNGRNMKRFDSEFDVETFITGLRDALGSKAALMNQNEIKDTMMKFKTDMDAKQAAEAASHGDKDKNKKDGEAFLAENKTKTGVVTLPSGLQYQVVTEGTGAMPKPTDMVTTDYRGTLIDGSVFDSSYDRGEPVQFPVNGVIKGWTEALQLMKVGAKWKLFIPSALAYGEGGSGPKIGPNSTLIFDIELHSIDKQ